MQANSPNLLAAIVFRAIIGAYGLAKLTTGVVLLILYVLKELRVIQI